MRSGGHGTTEWPREHTTHDTYTQTQKRKSDMLTIGVVFACKWCYQFHRLRRCDGCWDTASKQAYNMKVMYLSRLCPASFARFAALGHGLGFVND